MTIDPSNPVVQLCGQGMQAEGEGRLEDARALFARAWETSRDDYEACIAAHYLARHEATEEGRLTWNAEALRRAESADAERLRGFMPSLLLNLGHSHEMLGRRAMARAHYERARDALDAVPDGPYGEMVRDGITRALRRTAPESTVGDA
jgi:tetratricopeptide (TPR) repeat protein